VKTDAQLIKDARRDPDALGELYSRHAAGIHAWLAARTSTSTASELTAETFAQAALSLRRFRDERDGSAAPWLVGIARNLLRRSLERDRIEASARRRLGMPADAHDADLARIDERDRAARLEPALSAALGDLPATQRRALELRVLDELSYEQVASSLECSEVAARIRVTRALGSLSRRLKGAPS
jgi:RNA polymerase sigma-70 factor (ECF subfamily)